MEKLKFSKVNMIDVYDWDSLVESTYGRPYAFQQQDGCKSRGVYEITIPCYDWNDDIDRDEIPEKVNGDIMGVSFKSWLERDPKKPLDGEEKGSLDRLNLELFYHRNFYPDIQTIANDMYNKGLIEAGDYVINIDW